MLSHALNLILALGSLVFGGWLAFYYPIAQPFPIIAFFLFTALIYFRPWLWPILLPGFLPVIGLAPWTGWLTFEELDLLVLGAAAGAYTKNLFQPVCVVAKHFSRTLSILISLMAVSLLVSMFRGFSDAGGFVFGLYQGYNGPMNSVRIAKSFFLALLLLPSLKQLQTQDEARLGRNLGYGLALGLGLVSLATIWERLAFTDLLNFSSDYRTTALFWEMHVGGAALDGWLLLTAPFAIWLLGRAKTAIHSLIAFLLIGIVSYACLTTFSRGVYLGLVIALPLLGWLLFRRAQSTARGSSVSTWGAIRWALSIVLLGVMALLVFPGSGYRGLLGLLGFVAVALAMPPVIRAIPLSRVISSLVLGAIAGAVLALLADFVPKGVYLLYALWLAFTLAAIYRPNAASKAALSPGVMGFSGLALATVSCSLHWGGEVALPGIVGALIMVIALVIWGSLVKNPLWPNDLRWRVSMLTVCVAVSGIVAVFSGGAYMEGRFSTSGKDAEGRVAHWNSALSMLQSPLDLIVGKGLGRFPSNYFFAVPNSAVPGTYAIRNENASGYLSITAGHHPISFGDLFRVSQRLNLSAQGPFVLDFKVRAKADATIHVEVCEKHLLYVGQCHIRNVPIKASKGEWQSATIRLDGPVFANGSWYAPRFKMFSIGVESQGSVAEVDDLVLTEIGSANLLKNADFSNEMQHWFFSSDREHLPWHAKNLQMNMLFDQGLLGLLAAALLVIVVLWQINRGRGAQKELSPYMTTGIVGFLVVGLFDSLTDVPRLTFIYYLVLLYAMCLNSKSGHGNAPGNVRSKRCATD